MLKKTMTYTDYNGVRRTEDFWFNLSKAEIMEMEMGTAGGLAEMLQNIVNAQDGPAIIKTFKELVLKAYGEKTPDGKYFRKSPEISEAFSPVTFKIYHGNTVSSDVTSNSYFPSKPAHATSPLLSKEISLYVSEFTSKK